MAHHHHGHRAPAIGFEPFPHALGVIACGIHNVFTPDIALFGVHDPFTIFAADARCRVEPQDPRAHVAGSFCQRLCQLRRIDVAISRIIKRAFQIMCL